MNDLVNADELERRLEAAALRVEGAFEALNGAQQELDALLAIKNGLLALGVDTTSTTTVDDGTSSIGQPVANIFQSGGGQLSTRVPIRRPDSTRYIVAPVPKKVRSTGMVVDIVNEADGSLSVDDVLKRFEEKHGIPEGWTNPRNALNTALNRAANKGLIATETGGRFVSNRALLLDYEPGEVTTGG